MWNIIMRKIKRYVYYPEEVVEKGRRMDFGMGIVVVCGPANMAQVYRRNDSDENLYQAANGLQKINKVFFEKALNKGVRFWNATAVNSAFVLTVGFPVSSPMRPSYAALRVCQDFYSAYKDLPDCFDGIPPVCVVKYCEVAILKSHGKSGVVGYEVSEAISIQDDFFLIDDKGKSGILIDRVALGILPEYIRSHFEKNELKHPDEGVDLSEYYVCCDPEKVFNEMEEREKETN